MITKTAKSDIVGGAVQGLIKDKEYTKIPKETNGGAGLAKKVAYKKDYRMRQVGVGGVSVLIPRIVIDRAAERENQTVAAFIRTHKVTHLFNDFTDFDAAYRFTPIETTEEIEVPGEVT